MEIVHAMGFKAIAPQLRLLILGPAVHVRGTPQKLVISQIYRATQLILSQEQTQATAKVLLQQLRSKQ